MKLGKYILQIVPSKSYNFQLSLPYNNCIWYKTFNKFCFNFHGVIQCKHIKPNTGIQYKIIDRFWKILIIKQLN